ncbi:hypothetical protein E2562_026575 [Oryza meyeriana var. granulata]|uniref:Uncharacterized protein n=1 Tax=Oryza meyeriana var. granulata TaxID=110450 RepID=A0A6G1CT58_9ORYZ|nr:hypothetical protein E2562_026575 [Oryza meyeriana var. granulata]
MLKETKRRQPADAPPPGDDDGERREHRREKKPRKERSDPVLPSQIKNKNKRREVHAKLKREKKAQKRKLACERGQAVQRAVELGEQPPEKQVPRTIENTREPDETVCRPDDQELFAGNDADEFNAVLKQQITPKVLITTCRFNSGNHGNPTSHKPELVLNNFTTRLGHCIRRCFVNMNLFAPLLILF